MFFLETNMLLTMRLRSALFGSWLRCAAECRTGASVTCMMQYSITAYIFFSPVSLTYIAGYMSPQLIASFRRGASVSSPTTSPASIPPLTHGVDTEFGYATTVAAYHTDDDGDEPVSDIAQDAVSEAPRPGTPFVVNVRDDDMPPSSQPRPSWWNDPMATSTRLSSPAEDLTMEHYICLTYRGNAVCPDVIN